MSVDLKELPTKPTHFEGRKFMLSQVLKILELSTAEVPNWASFLGLTPRPDLLVCPVTGQRIGEEAIVASLAWYREGNFQYELRLIKHGSPIPVRCLEVEIFDPERFGFDLKTWQDRLIACIAGHLARPVVK